jgi:hypothetical protein
MSGHRPFNQLRKRMSPERRARNAAATKEMLGEMALHELRQARERSQEELARALRSASRRSPSSNDARICT